MFDAGISIESLRDCLAGLSPVELKGMALLRQGPPALFPESVPREQLREAVIEIIAYTNRCQIAADRLATLAAVPLLTVTIPEFGL